MRIEKRYYYKLILPLAGIIVFFVLLEISLRLGGSLFLLAQEYRNRASLRQPGTCRILCVGESTTAYGYPSFLEEILNKKTKQIKFAVINKGIPGTNSTAIVDQIPKYLEQYRPRIVLAMMGINDYDYNNVIYQFQETESYKGFIDSLRTYKLFKRIKLGLERKIGSNMDNTGILALRIMPKDEPRTRMRLEPLRGKAKEYYDKGNIDSQQGKYEDALKMYEKALMLDRSYHDIYFKLGWTNIILLRLDKAEYFFRKAAEYNPGDYYAYDSLGFCLLNEGKFKEAEQALKKAIKINDLNDRTYVSLGQCYMKQNKYLEAEEIFKKALQANPYNDKAYGALAQLYQKKSDYDSASYCFEKANKIRMEIYHPETRRNLNRLKDILERNHVILICVQYPVRSVETLKKMFNSTSGVYFVDNEASFKDAIGREGYEAYFTDRFGGDFGHCTGKGNFLLADNIAGVILKIIDGT